MALIDQPDCMLVLDKQRNGETEGRYRLFFDKSSMQYNEERNQLPKQFKCEHDVPTDDMEF